MPNLPLSQSRRAKKTIQSHSPTNALGDDLNTVLQEGFRMMLSKARRQDCQSGQGERSNERTHLISKQQTNETAPPRVTWGSSADSRSRDDDVVVPQLVVTDVEGLRFTMETDSARKEQNDFVSLAPWEEAEMKLALTGLMQRMSPRKFSATRSTGILTLMSPSIGVWSWRTRTTSLPGVQEPWTRVRRDECFSISS